MADKIRINYAGQDVEALPVEVNQAQEQWNHYLLDDGSLLKIKLVVTSVVKVDARYDEERNPVYLVKSTNVINVTSPESLKKPREPRS